MSRVGIWLMFVLGMAQAVNGYDLSIVQRRVKAIANGYQVTLGIDSTGAPEAVAGWQLAFQISPDNLTIDVAEPEDYLFADSNYSALYWMLDESTPSTLFNGYGDPPQYPIAGSNLVRIDLTSDSEEHFDFNMALIAFNQEDQSGSFWYSADDPLTPRPFVPEPSCSLILLSGGVAYLVIVAKRNRWTSRVFSILARRLLDFTITSGYRF